LEGTNARNLGYSFGEISDRPIPLPTGSPWDGDRQRGGEMIPEKLVKELGAILYGLYGISSGLPKGRCIVEAITYIGLAYADGELPLPGEEVRITSDVEGPIINAIKGYTYIALEGEGKEEEE